MRRRIVLGILAVVIAAAGAAWWYRAELKAFSYEGTDRDTWQQPERVLQALALRPGDRVADIGAGGAISRFVSRAPLGRRARCTRWTLTRT